MGFEAVTSPGPGAELEKSLLSALRDERGISEWDYTVQKGIHYVSRLERG